MSRKSRKGKKEMIVLDVGKMLEIDRQKETHEKRMLDVVLRILQETNEIAANPSHYSPARIKSLYDEVIESAESLRDDAVNTLKVIKKGKTIWR